jgi:hypothetical protein
MTEKTIDETKIAKRRWAQKFGDFASDELIEHVTSDRTPIEQELYYKLLQRRLPVNYYLKEQKPCMCGQDQTIEHLFYECPISLQFWSQIRVFIQDLLSLNDQEFEIITIKDVILCFPDLTGRLTSEELQLLRIVHSVALHCIWSTRNDEAKDLMVFELFLLKFKARLYLSVPEESSLDSDLFEFTEDGLAFRI